MKGRTLLLGMVIFLVSSCGEKSRENQILSSLGVPKGAKTVVIFQQTSHLDLDWLMTFDDYYTNRVEGIYRDVLEILKKNKNYTYTIGLIGFFRRFFEEHPELADFVKSKYRSGNLKFIGGGVSSPDTLLPSGESILMNYETGLLWLEKNLGKPSIWTAWLPDSFGHSPSLPDILSFMGYKSVTFARIDGATSDLDRSLEIMVGIEEPHPDPGSTAEILWELKSTDFLWVGPNGGKVVAHWMPFNLYCLGGSVDSGVHIPLVNNVITPGSMQRDLVLREMAYLISLMKKVSPTPYIFIPVGCDFEKPKKFLADYVRWWNEYRYPETGTYAVLASFQEYGDLLWERRSQIPVMNADLNPYFMGFYASRPDIKTGVRQNLYFLLSAEWAKALAVYEGASQSEEKTDSLYQLWWENSFTTHHDFVTGTSPDSVYRTEQKEMLGEIQSGALNLLNYYLSRLTSTGTLSTEPMTDEALVFNPSGITSSTHTLLYTFSTSPESTSFTALKGKVQGTDYVSPVDYLYSFEVTSGIYAHVYEGDLLEVPPFGWRKVKLINSEVPLPYAITYYSGGTPTTKDSPFDSVVITAPHFTLTFSLDDYWALSLMKDANGEEVITSGSFYPAVYYDEGGTWELGHEMKGCSFQLMKLPGSGSQLYISTSKSKISVSISYPSTGVTVKYYIYPYQNYVDVEFTGSAFDSTTVTFMAHLKNSIDEAWFSVPFGQVSRPSEKIFSPTFWPSSEWVSFKTGAGYLLIANRGLQAWHYTESGKIEGILFRNVSLEKCRLLTVPTFTASNPETFTHRIRLYVEDQFSPADWWRKAISYNYESGLEYLNRRLSSPDDSYSIVQVSGDGVATSLMEREGTYRLRLFFPEFSTGKNSAQIKMSDGLYFYKAVDETFSPAAHVYCRRNLCTLEAEKPIVNFYFKGKKQ